MVAKKWWEGWLSNIVDNIMYQQQVRGFEIFFEVFVQLDTLSPRSEEKSNAPHTPGNARKHLAKNEF